MLSRSELRILFPTETNTSRGRGADGGKVGWRRNPKDKGTAARNSKHV